MISMADLAVQGDGASASAATRPPSYAEPPPTVLELSIWSDTICPWCYVGKRRVERAAEELKAEGVSLAIRWLPFELNPSMPAAGLDRRVYRSAKFGSWERSQELDAQVAAEAARDEIAFRHDLMRRTPNTRASHRLIWLAGELGGAKAQGRVVEELFSAYFCRGLDVGDRTVLADIGDAAGLAGERVLAFLDGQEGLSEVLRLEAWATSAGLRGVPSVIAGSLLLFSGAPRAPLIARALREVALARSGAATATSAGAGLDAQT